MITDIKLLSPVDEWFFRNDGHGYYYRALVTDENGNSKEELLERFDLKVAMSKVKLLKYGVNIKDIEEFEQAIHDRTFDEASDAFEMEQ